MKLKQEVVDAKTIALALLRVATSPFGLRTAMFFSVSIVILVVLVFRGGVSKTVLWILPVPLFIFSAILAFSSLWNSRSTSIEGPLVYDKAKYHYDGDFPKGLPRKQAFVHTGMFIGWLIDHGMIADEFLQETHGFK